MDDLLSTNIATQHRTSILTKDISLDELQEQLQEIKNKCTDFYSSDVSFDDKLNLIFTDAKGEYRTSKMSLWAMQQLCDKTGVPFTYIKRCIDKGKPALAQFNLNVWLREFKNEYLIRQYNQQIRGLLSSQYSIYDGTDIIKQISSNFTLNKGLANGDYIVKGHYIDENRFHLRIIEKEQLPIEDEDLFAGIVIDNSDVGMCGLRVSFIVYKQICTNGMIVSRNSHPIYKAIHKGFDLDASSIGDNVAVALLNIDNVKEMIVKAVAKAKGKALKSDEEIDLLFAKLNKKVPIGKEGIEKAKDLLNKYGNTQWGFSQAITEMSQKYDIETRINLERIAGDFILVA